MTVSCDRCNARLAEKQNASKGSIFLRNVIFVLLLAILFLIELSYQDCDSKVLTKIEQVLEKIEKIKPGMILMQVESIIGPAQKNEDAPFTKGNIPFEDPESLNGQDAKNLLIADNRAHYELTYTSSDDQLQAYCLDVYYDSQSRVCFVHHGQKDKLMWDLVEMY